ncbi:MAG: M23 family metallopeptidase [Candidatus Nanoarchaeia archaeon]|nr:M23 family metallopeptidase [Candidatus Nanoarchaeia archaeon]
MKLYRPIKTNLQSQGYGIKGTQPRMLAFYQSLGLTAHNGFDLVAKDLEPCYFNYYGKGKVYRLTDDPLLGVGVDVLVQDTEGIFQLRFWHFKSYVVKAGQEVESGDLIGYCDNTGQSTGTHLHFDLAEGTFQNNGTFDLINRDNGFFGKIDPYPYWDNRFVLDVKYNVEEQVSILQKMINTIKSLIGLLLNKGQK